MPCSPVSCWRRPSSRFEGSRCYYAHRVCLHAVGSQSGTPALSIRANLTVTPRGGPGGCHAAGANEMEETVSTQHTPGPWEYGVRRDGSLWLSLGDPAEPQAAQEVK